MSATLTFRDQSMTGETLGEWAMEFLTERITVRELIRSRVYQEVQDNNNQQMQGAHWLVQPADLEKRLNSDKAGRAFKPKLVDWHKQFEIATEAFEKNQILVLIGERQAESLDEEIEIRPGTDVTFLRMTLLVGG